MISYAQVRFGQSTRAQSDIFQFLEAKRQFCKIKYKTTNMYEEGGGNLGCNNHKLIE